ncbi:hypothetical protein [Rufibacter radiotolerans]|nr:hypothetical protein [Rufibacter radiotolerans]
MTEWDPEGLHSGVQVIVHIIKPETDLPPLQTSCAHPFTIKFFDDKVDAITWITEELETNPSA